MSSKTSSNEKCTDCPESNGDIEFGYRTTKHVVNHCSTCKKGLCLEHYQKGIKNGGGLAKCDQCCWFEIG